MVNLIALIDEVWLEKVYGKFVFRGMDRNDLKFPLFNSSDPFKAVHNQIIKFLDLLGILLNKGYAFEVEETHFGKSSKQNLGNIVKWTRRDLDLKEIYFTSSYESAKDYADCWQGSQLRQNVKTIIDHLLQETPVTLSEEDIHLIKKISGWANLPRAPKPVILHVQRSSVLFNPVDNTFNPDKLLPLGSKEFFRKNVLARLGTAKDIGKEKVCSLFPKETDEFYCSLCKPLKEASIVKIEEL